MPPAAPTTKFGDKAVTVDWVTPVGEFTPVTKFNVEISPVPAGQNAQQTGLTGNSFTWPGLQNGTEYQFRVQAINKAPKPSDWGPYSASVVPAGVPAAPNAPTVTGLEPVGSQNHISVQWNEPFINGAAITEYTLTQSGGGQSVKTYTTTTNSETVTVNNSTAPYTFTVTAKNKAGIGAASSASTPQRAVGKVDPMAKPQVTIANQNAAGGRVTVDYTPLDEAQRKGYAANEVTYCVTLSTSAEQCGVASGAVLASPNGVGVFATVRARAAAGGQSSVGDASPASGTVVPHGVPGSAKVSGSDGAQDSQNVSYSWSYPTGAVDAASIEVNVDGGGWVAKSGNGSATYNTGGWSKSVTIKVRAKNSVGTYGAVDSKTLTSGAKKPDPPVTEVIVEAGTWHSCTQGPGEGDNFYSSGGSLYCDGTRSPGGDVNLGGKWLDRADGWVQVSGCARSGWYTMSSGPHPGRWVKANTVDVRDRNGGNIRC